MNYYCVSTVYYNIVLHLLIDRSVYITLCIYYIRLTHVDDGQPNCL